MHRVLSEAVALLTVKSAVHALLFFGADELSVHGDIRLVTGRPWTHIQYIKPPWCEHVGAQYFIIYHRKHTIKHIHDEIYNVFNNKKYSVPCTVTVRLQVRLFPAASVAVYWTRVSPTGNTEPGVWLLVSVRRPPERDTHYRRENAPRLIQINDVVTEIIRKIYS